MSATQLALRGPSARAHASSYSAGRRKLAVAVVALAFVMDLMDSTILTIALPTIQRHMHASPAAVNWMAGAYTLAFAVLLITGGRMGDIFGYRRRWSRRCSPSCSCSTSLSSGSPSTGCSEAWECSRPRSPPW